MGEWKDTPLSEVADLLPGYAFKGMDFGVGTSRGVKIKDVQSGVVAVESLDALDVTSYNQERIKKYRLNAGDHLITMTGNLGRVATIPESAYEIYLNQRVAKLLPKPNVIEDFLLYVIKSSDFIDYCITHADSETAQPNISAGTILEYEFALPPEGEQRAIASVLSSLDAKIDLLHRQNKTLEAMAEALFRQWFVEEAEEGWEEGKLPDEFDFTMGQSPPGSSFNEDGIGLPMYQGNADFGFRFPQRRVFTTDSQRNAEPFDTLISVRAPVGEQNMARETCSIGRGVAAFRYRKNKSFYTYTYFKLRSMMAEIKRFNEEGTVFGSIGKNDFKDLDIVIPSDSAIAEYEQQCKPMNDRVISNCTSIDTLTTLRDTLLPKLMSGEVRVEEISTSSER